MAVNIAATDQRFVRLLDRTLQMTSVTSGFSAEIRADETGEASTTGVRELGARGIAIALVAVGVEDQATLNLTRALGCAAAQGYGLAKPMAIRALAAWARERG